MRFILLTLFLAACQPSFADVRFDISLGSFVGDDNRAGLKGNIPFWGNIYYETDYLYAGVGHESGADRNGDEFDGEYSLVGAKIGKPLSAGVQARKFFHGDLSAGDTVFDMDVCINRNSVRFCGFRSISESDDYDTQGLKAGYTF